MIWRLLSLFLLLLYLPCRAQTQKENEYTINTAPRSEIKALGNRLFSPLRIIHIGDSHLQSGYLADEVRKTIEKNYPLAGYGAITPYRIAGTNAPESYSYTSPEKWIDCRLSYTNSCIPMSPTCITIKRNGASFSFNIKCFRYPFNTIVYFRETFSPPLKIKGEKAAYIAGTSERAGMVADTLILPSSKREVTLIPAKSTSKTYTYGGAVLMDSHEELFPFVRPVLYSSIALNGAMYANYDRDEVSKSLSLLHPHIIIISLGTNESLSPRFNSEEFQRQADRLVHRLSNEMPTATIVLTSPPASFNLRKTFNSNTQKVSAALEYISKKYHCLYYDLYRGMGEREGAIRRRKTGEYYNRDGIHFTIKGYQELGTLIANYLLGVINEMQQVK